MMRRIKQNIREFLFLVASCSLLICSTALAQKRVDFSGNVDFNKQQLELQLNLPENVSVSSSDFPSGAIAAKLSKLSDQDYVLSLKTDHFKAMAYDVSTELETSFSMKNLNENFESFISGKLKAQNALVNLKPVSNVSAEFEIKDHKLSVNNLIFDHVVVDGSLDLVEPYKVDVSVRLKQMTMQDFLNFWVAENDYRSAGDVSGDIKVSGTVDKFLLKGSLKASTGFVEELQFDTIVLNAEGVFPQLQIAQSRLAQSDGAIVNLEGPIDLSDKENFKKQLKALNITPVVKEGKDGSSWTIKQTKEDKAGTTEVKYMLRKDNLNPSTSEHSSDMMGLERSVQF